MASRIQIRPISPIQLKGGIQLPLTKEKSEKRPIDELDNETKVQTLKKKKISLQDYKLRHSIGSHNNSVTVRPEEKFEDMPSRLYYDGLLNSVDQVDDKKKIFDPIREAGNRALVKLKKAKAEANKRREEAVIKSRMRKTENVQFQPLLLALPEPMEKSQRLTSRSSSSLSDSSSGYSSSTISSRKSQQSCRENNTPVDELKVVFVGRLEDDVTKQKLGNEFSKFGRVVKVQLHSKEDGTRYGFVTYERSRDAWSAVKAAGTFAQYDVRFGAHCAYRRPSDADLDGLR